MKLRSQYYHLKPYLPWRLRMALRRRLARRKRARCPDIWPIKPGTEKPPQDWPGWPEGKKFAVVLTHDVEGPKGLARVKQLAEIEMKLGFRSSFNFIPEGDYQVTKELRDWLTSNGFEVGVHDLHHDGKLYASREAFRAHAQKINHYLKEWGAVGFRSGFMHHNLDWIHDLNIEYDASTFDTDPFEPQPDGVDTIFPFWVPPPTHNLNPNPDHDLAPSPHSSPAVQSSEFRVQGSKFGSPPDPSTFKIPVSGTRNSELGTLNSEGGTRNPQPSTLNLQPSTNDSDPSSIIHHPSSLNIPRSGYVELPYTLAQDFSLFLLFREQSTEIWRRKLDWVAEHGGMAMVDVHPDYMRFEETGPSDPRYALSLYAEFLLYISQKFKDQYWQALPREVAADVRKRMSPISRHVTHIKHHASPPKIWIDLDNTPHVPLFDPIMEELRARGFPLLVTARDAFQVCDLADKMGMQYIQIGRHHGKNRLMKGAGLAYRSLQLAPLVVREKPVLAVSHGARSQILLSNWLRIPTLLMEDYEFSQFPPMMRPTWALAPTVIPDSALCCKNGHIRKYPGIKEDVYAWKLNPDPAILKKLGLVGSDLIVTVRPPATEAHYHNPESEKLFDSFMERACQASHVKIVLLPRNKKQGDRIRRQVPKWFENGKTVIPNGAVDGMNLIWHSDLVVSGGGTMNREAAALGVPVYSIFRGTIGAVDHNLKAEGRLVLVESVEDVQQKIRLVKRPRKSITEVTSKQTLLKIVDTIQEIAEMQCRK